MPMFSHHPHNNARDFFPRGLRQPGESFRFSMDALLLASYVRPGKAKRILDLGCGCGVIGLAILLRYPSLHVVGADIIPELIACAEQNAALLNFNENFSAVKLDLRDIKNPASSLRPESFDLVVANPPYRRHGQGRPPQTNMRESALFESAGTLPDFIRAAAFTLKNKGTLYCIWSSERLAELVGILAEYRLQPKQLRPVQARAGKECGLFLLRATKNGRPGLKLEPPLVIYEQNPEAGQVEPDEQAEQSMRCKTKLTFPYWLPGQSEPLEETLLGNANLKSEQNRLTLEALEFCPWLACNARRESADPAPLPSLRLSR